LDHGSNCPVSGKFARTNTHCLAYLDGHSNFHPSTHLDQPAHPNPADADGNANCDAYTYRIPDLDSIADALANRNTDPYIHFYAIALAIQHADFGAAYRDVHS
jgi:hypothetical protein